MNDCNLWKMFHATISRCSQLIFMFSGKQPPDNDEFGRWYWELPLTARLVVYITVLGTLMAIIFLLLKFLNDCDIEPDTDSQGEEAPLLNGPSEVTWKVDIETASFSSLEDVDYSKLCVICFAERRNCFFVPCGHSATCKGCAQKILSKESKVCVCPICRRVIRKAKRFLKLNRSCFT